MCPKQSLEVEKGYWMAVGQKPPVHLHMFVGKRKTNLVLTCLDVGISLNERPPNMVCALLTSHQNNPQKDISLSKPHTPPISNQTPSHSIFRACLQETGRSGCAQARRASRHQAPLTAIVEALVTKKVQKQMLTACSQQVSKPGTRGSNQDGE